MEKATFAAGCFRGVEASFQLVEGVLDTFVGYGGGSVDNPTCDEVATGKTGHAQSVRVSYDPSKVSYQQLLDVFWECHDPTQLNRQGPHYGSQYRSAIFVHGPEQEMVAKKALHAEQTNGSYTRPIVTEIEKGNAFWPLKDDEAQPQNYPADKPDMVC